MYYNAASNSYLTSTVDNAKTNFGLGAAVGAKFLTKNGFTGEVYGGVGRFLGNNRSIEAYPRIGITLKDFNQKKRGSKASFFHFSVYLCVLYHGGLCLFHESHHDLY